MPTKHGCLYTGIVRACSRSCRDSHMHHRDLEQYKAGGDSASIPFILFKILYEAPLTMTLMTPQCWSAVSGCSKQLRHLIQQKTRVVYVDHLDEVDAEHHRWRPQLCLIIVRKPCAIHDKCITSFLSRTHLSTYPQHRTPFGQHSALHACTAFHEATQVCCKGYSHTDRRPATMLDKVGPQ